MVNQFSSPKISFGIIVLNGEPFTKYCLRQIYPYAYQIIVVEGGSKKATNIAPAGHSTDGTLEVLYEFKEKEDRDNKMQIIVKDGFWKDKDEQSQAYFKRATGDYLWQIDIDEFYKNEDIEKIKNLLASDPSIDTISFEQKCFWGSLNYLCDGVYLHLNSEYHRIFKIGPGYQLVDHRPPTVIDSAGTDLRKKKWIRSKVTKKLGIYFYHYSLLFPKQVKEKCNYYVQPGETHHRGSENWFEQAYLKLGRPFTVHNVYKYPSWLLRYEGQHPKQIEKMRLDIQSGNMKVETRITNDVEQLLSSKKYSRLRSILILLNNVMFIKLLRFIYQIFKYLFKKHGSSPKIIAMNFIRIEKYLLPFIKIIDNKLSKDIDLIEERKSLIVFCFHSTLRNKDEILKNIIDPRQGITVDDFRLLIEYYLHCNYKFISPNDILKGINQKSIMVTFDDGYANNLNIFPILKEYNIPAVLFISIDNIIHNKCFWWDVLYRKLINLGVSENEIIEKGLRLKLQKTEEIEKYLVDKFGKESFMPLSDIDRPFNIKEIKELSKEKIISIGNHTYNHSTLTSYSESEAKLQIKKSQDYLFNLTGIEPIAIAYPSGKYSRNIIDSSRDAGLKIGFTTEGIKNYLPMKLQSDDIMTIGRFTFRNDIPLLEQLKSYSYDNVFFNKYMHIKRIIKRVI